MRSLANLWERRRGVDYMYGSAVFCLRSFFVTMATYASDAHAWSIVVFHTEPIPLHLLIELAVVQEHFAPMAANQRIASEESLHIQTAFRLTLLYKPSLSNTT